MCIFELLARMRQRASSAEAFGVKWGRVEMTSHACRL